MKTKTFLTLVTLAVITSSSSAAANQPDPKIHVLPTYVVTAPRYQPAELKIQTRLNELRQQASAPVTVAPELPLLKAPTPEPGNLVKILRASSPKIVAKS